MEEKRDPKCCERYKVACFQTFQDIWDWESWLQNLCYKCNGKKIVQFHLTLAGTTWKRIEGDPLFEHAMLNLLGSTLLISHRSAKSKNSFTGYKKRWETYCILSQGVLPMFQFNILKGLYTEREWQWHPPSMRYQIFLETEKATQSAFGSSRNEVLSWLIYGRLQRERNLCAWGCTDPDICSSGELIKLLRVVMVQCQVSPIYISHPLQGEQ